MSDLSTISSMFEELKQILKRVESNSTKSENSVNQNVISTSDLANIANQVSQSEELIIQKLEQIEQTQTAPKKIHHRVSIDIKSSWVFLTIIGLFLFLSISLVFNYSQKQENNRLTDNDIKYRFIKASNQVDSIKLSELENIFTYDRSEKAIKELQERVVTYEKALEEQSRRLEQANFKEQEAERLKQEAQELKRSK